MKKFFMAIIALMMTLSASAQFFIYFSDGTVAKVDSISMVAPADAEDPTNPNNPTTPSQGIGVFSVSATKQVTFSPGNLQYTQSTNTWSFAEKQYDYIGTDNVIGGSVSTDATYGDSKTGTALADKVDLFGWSTSTMMNFGVSTSTDYNDYTGSFVDWGTNTIGNDAPNTWRTLTDDEWSYLLNARTNANSLIGVAQVNGVNGLVFLPDTWACPAGVTFKSGFNGYGIEYFAVHQTFTAEEWAKLEVAGAVFLPAAGRSSGTTVRYVQGIGDYWSATKSDISTAAYYLTFDSNIASISEGGRQRGHGVRLVKDIQ